MLVGSWCKFGATLYDTILTIFTISHEITRYLTIFTISNGTAKTPRDKLLFLIYKKLCFGRAFCFAIYFSRGICYNTING